MQFVYQVQVKYIHKDQFLSPYTDLYANGLNNSDRECELQFGWSEILNDIIKLLTGSNKRYYYCPSIMKTKLPLVSHS